jgi:hypothetical protein
MSMREMIVPKSLAAQRTKAKTLPGRRRRHGGGGRAPVRGFAAEPDPVLDPLFDPGQLDMGEAVGCAIGAGRRTRRTALPVMMVSFGRGNSRASRSRSMSATVTPRRNAAILIRPRSSASRRW